MQLIPYFQPIIDISTAQVVGHEALARAIDHDGKVTSAGPMFCDRALDEQKVLAFDRAVRMQALEAFSQAGQPGFLTLNISPRWVDLLEEQKIPTLEMLKMYNISPDRVVVEIVETDSNPEKLANIVKRYKDIGVRVAVDDFGAGYSQFDRVIKLEPDIVKLDMRLFKKAIKGGFPQHIVQSLSFLAERMGSQVLCEGVETYNELRFALEIGSKLIQGFMFSSAQDDFTQADRFKHEISIQRKRFLLEGIRNEERVIDDSREIHQQIHSLISKLRDSGQPLFASDILVNNPRVFRMFVCDHGGTQISPSFLRKEDGWSGSGWNIGANWCWRPYFYQLLSSAEIMKRESVTSRAYHDYITGELIKTIACFIDSDRVLMVDIKEPESYTIQ